MDKPDIAVVVLCLLGIATVFFLSFRDSFDIFCLSTCTTFFLFIFLAGHLNEDFAVRKITKRSSVSKALMWTGLLLALFTIIQTSNSGEYSPWQSVGCYSSLILILIPWLVLASKEDILKIEGRERKKREWNGGLSPSSNIRTWRKLSKEELDYILKHRGWNRGGTADDGISGSCTSTGLDFEFRNVDGVIIAEIQGGAHNWLGRGFEVTNECEWHEGDNTDWTTYWTTVTFTFPEEPVRMVLIGSDVTYTFE